MDARSLDVAHLVDLAGRDVVVLGEGYVEEALVVTQVQVAL